MKLFVKLLFCLTLLCPASALADLPRQVELDYSVLSGYVVMPINDEYIVDLDASDNLHVGDILTLVTEGKTIYHPVSKVVLGSVVVPTGYLQVTRINSGYSYAKVLSGGAEPKNGDQVRRFEQVPALFVDKQGSDGELFGLVKTGLPQFKWLQPGDSEQPLLTFTLQDETLVVKNFEGTLLHSYAVENSQALVARTEPVRRSYVTRSTKPEPSPLKKVSNTLLGALNLQGEDPFSTENIGLIREVSAEKRGAWMSPNLNGHPAGVVVADLDGDGLQEIAVALNNSLLISQNNKGEYIEKADVPIPAWLKLLSLDALDLDKNGRPELYLTAIVGYQLASFVVVYNGSDYEIVIDKVRWYLRAVELPGQGQVLIGQEMSNGKESFTGKPFYVHLEKDRLIKGDEINLPGRVNMFSLMPFTDKENRLYYAYLTESDYLKVVSADGVELWVSGEYYGGSETCFDNRKGHDGDTVLPTCVRSRLVKTADNEILVAQNVGPRLMKIQT
jgi:hypothetical protein